MVRCHAFAAPQKPISAAFSPPLPGTATRLAVTMHRRALVEALCRATRQTCRRALREPQSTHRAFSMESTVPLREFPASMTNLDGVRGVLRLAGGDVLPFLQGLVTNDVMPLQSRDAGPIYAALLNAQGRQLHDMFVFRSQDGDDPVFLLDVDNKGLTELKKKLTTYKLRAKVDIKDVSSEFSVWTRFGQGRLPTEGWSMDPRLEDLGQRTIRGKKDKPPAGADETETTPLEYQRWRALNGVAEGDTEMASGHAMPLEYNMDALQAISYSKGCYVGQELIARTHNRGVVRKRLMPVVIEATVSSGTTRRHSQSLIVSHAMKGPRGSARLCMQHFSRLHESQGPAPCIVCPALVHKAGDEPSVGETISSDGSKVGELRLVDGRTGLAHLRLKQGLAAADSALTLSAAGAKIRPWRPTWWPGEWGREEESSAEAA